MHLFVKLYNYFVKQIKIVLQYPYHSFSHLFEVSIPPPSQTLKAHMTNHIPRSTIRIIHNFAPHCCQAFGVRVAVTIDRAAVSHVYYSGGVAQLARAPALQAGGHRFDSVHLHHQSVFLRPANSWMPHCLRNQSRSIM